MNLLRGVILVALAVFSTHALYAADRRPNIIFILADDLGGGDIGMYFQNARRTANNRSEPWFQTPKLDAMAAEGIQLQQHYCGAPVCAPSRASLMLGVHQGHANVRDNQFDKGLENNQTLGTVLRQSGYTTAAIGKWGLQGTNAAHPTDWPAHPLNRGFDFYFGYIRHSDGHEHYPKEGLYRKPKEVWENRTEISASLDLCYTTDLFTARAKKWIVDQRSRDSRRPFFLYLAYDTPHAVLELPTQPYPAGGGRKGGLQWIGQPGHMINTASGRPDSYYYPDYAGATWDHDRNPATSEVPWPDVYKRFASDVRRIDDCVGDLLQLLKDLHIDDNTLVVFTSDNGPSRESYLKEDYEANFFNSFGPHDGIKRDLWEAGIRVGAMVRWPGRIPAGRISQQPSAFWDWMPTLAEVAGIPAPARTDGVSLVPTLLGKAGQGSSRLYFEYFEGGKTPAYDEFASAHRGRDRKNMQAIRLGDYMGVRYKIAGQGDPFEIYNIINDPKETNNLATTPTGLSLQRAMHDTVLRVRRPDAQAKRPYDVELVPAVVVAGLIPGIEWRAYRQSVPWPARLEDVRPVSSGTVSSFAGSGSVGGQVGEVIFQGYIEAPEDGDYTFRVKTGGGVLLRIHEATVIDSGLAAEVETEASGAIRLQKGLHPFRLYVRTDRGVGRVPDLIWESPGGGRLAIPTTALFHPMSPAEHSPTKQR